MNGCFSEWRCGSPFGRRLVLVFRQQRLELAVLATGLGAVGIYAVLADHVALNKKEIGVRIALGAQPGAVVGNIVRSGIILAGIGILLR